jgi:hypothetical protein
LTPFSLPMFVGLIACGVPKGGVVVDPHEDDAGDTGLPTIEVGTAELVGIAGGTFQLGEWDALIVHRYGGDGSEDQTVIPESVFAFDAYWIDRYPFPGVPGAPWFGDGLNHDAVATLDAWLADYGRRVCTVSELLLAAAGPDNFRYPYLDGEYDINACEPDDANPQPMGSFALCESANGVRDFQVHSAWGWLDAQTVALMDSTPQRPGFPGDITYAAWGGTSRTDTYYAPSNFGFHLHGRVDAPYGDDGVRVCAGPDAPTSEQNAAYGYWLEDAVAGGSFTALFE